MVGERSLRLEGGFAFLAVELRAVGARVLCQGGCVNVAFVARLAAEPRNMGDGVQVLV